MKATTVSSSYVKLAGAFPLKISQKMQSRTSAARSLREPREAYSESVDDSIGAPFGTVEPLTTGGDDSACPICWAGSEPLAATAASPFTEVSAARGPRRRRRGLR